MGDDVINVTGIRIPVMARDGTRFLTLTAEEVECLLDSEKCPECPHLKALHSVGCHCVECPCEYVTV